MARLELVDTHVHFWDLTHPKLHYAVLQPDYYHPQLRERLDMLKGSNYLVEDYINEIQGSNVSKAVHVQAALGSEDPVKESEWLRQSADQTGFPHTIVAHSDLRDPKVEEELERHLAYPNVKGIRDFSYGDYLISSDFHRGYALLDKFDLIASLDVKWEDMFKLKKLATKFPKTIIVLDHCGFPLERTDDYFHNWSLAIKSLAEADNVICKLSGLGMCDWNWTVDSIRPWLLQCIEAFGPERCVLATNWPIDRLFSTYEVLIQAYDQVFDAFSLDERIAMYSGNAERLYAI